MRLKPPGWEGESGGKTSIKGGKKMSALGSLSTRLVRNLNRAYPLAWKAKLGTRLNSLWSNGNFIYSVVQAGNVSTGEKKICMVIPVDCTVKTIRAMVKTGGSGTSVTTTEVDVNIDDISMLTTAIVLAAAEGYSRGLASLNSAKVALSANSVLTVDVDQIPDSVTSSDLSISIVLAPSET